MLYFQDLFAFFTGHSWEFILDLMSYHVGNDLIHPVNIIRHLGNVFSIAHDDNTVYNVLQFLQTVGYVDNTDTLRL